MVLVQKEIKRVTIRKKEEQITTIYGPSGETTGTTSVYSDVAPSDGLYRISADVKAYMSGYYGCIDIIVNGTTVKTFKTDSTSYVSFSYDIQLETLDIVELYLYGTQNQYAGCRNVQLDIVDINRIENQIRPVVSWDMDKWALSQTSNALSGTWWGGIYFNNDGTKIFLSQYGNGGRIYECELSTPYDITTINNFNKYISFTYPEDIHFSTDGTKMVTLKNDEPPYQIKRYTLSTARDMSTATNDQNISRNKGWDRGLYITPDGKNIYVGTAGNTHQVEKYTLSTAWDLTTAGTSTIVSSTLGGIGIWFGNNGKMFFKQNEGESDLSYYNLSTPYDLSTATLSGTKNVGANRAGGIWFNDNGTVCTIVGGGTGTNYITKYTL